MVQYHEDGFEMRSQPMDDGIVRIGHGIQIRRYRDTSIRGAELKPFIEGPPRAEPVLIYVPDEVSGRAKWKCELRTLADWRIQLQDGYPTGFDSLPDEVRLDSEFDILWGNLRESILRVRGFWVNPTRNLDLPDGRAVNLVIGPVGGHNLLEAALRIFSDEQRCWIEYRNS